MNYNNPLLKSFLLTIILLTSLAGYGQEVLTITVPSRAGDICELYYSGRFQSIILDKQGCCKVELDPLMTFCYVTIKDDVRFSVYTGGKSLRASVDSNKKVTFIGKHANACEHLNEVQYPFFISLGISALSEFLTKLNENFESKLKVLKNANIRDKQFEKDQRLKFEYYYAQLLLQYFVSNSKEITNKYRQLFDKLCVEDKSKLFSVEYTFFLYAYSAAKLNPPHENKIIFDNNRIIAIAKDVVSNYKNKSIVETVLHHIAKTDVDRYGNSSAFDAIYRKNVTSEILLREYNEIYTKWSNVMTGVMFPTFDLTDINDNNFNLLKYKGKYVVIDMWATWCSPCLREQKIMLSIEPDYEGQDVLFVTISCDQGREKWKNYVKQNLTGIDHYNTKNSDFNKLYGITTIPRFMLLDREGKILSPNFHKPSSSNFRKTLDFLLKQ